MVFHMSGNDKVAKGDIIRMDFDGYIASSGEMFDTTSAEKAKDAGIFDEKFRYAPMPILVGGGRVFEGLEEAIIGATVGEETEVVIPAEKAAGARDPKLVETLAVKEFLKQRIEPRPGMEVNIRNKTGVITSVTAGRVRVDFNRRFAGMDLKYKFTVLSKVEGEEDKMLAVVEMDYGSNEGFKVAKDEERVSVTLPDVCKYDQKWLLAKYRIVADLREVYPSVTVAFIEEYAKAEKKPAAEEKAPEELGSEEDQ
jgi:FKBP-type peptidyl-prolyl cis-trans isomerase 2